jgi:hypothetical protein
MRFRRKTSDLSLTQAVTTKPKVQPRARMPAGRPVNLSQLTRTVEAIQTLKMVISQ